MRLGDLVCRCKYQRVRIHPVAQTQSVADGIKEIEIFHILRDKTEPCVGLNWVQTFGKQNNIETLPRKVVLLT